MPRLPQAPPPGVFRGATPLASAGRWFDANLVRFRQGQIQPMGGWVSLPGTSQTSPVRDIITWHDNSHVRWAAIGCDTGLFAYRFDTHAIYTITPAGVGPLDPPGAMTGWGTGTYGAAAYGTERDAADIGPQDIAATQGDRWSMDTFGETLLIVPTQDGHLYEWHPATPATLPTIVANAPTMNKGVIVTDQRHVVLYGAGNNPRNIAWSDQENYTVWTPDVTNLAGSKLLVTQSYAMTAIKVNGGILIFTANDLHQMTYVGPPYAYGIVQVAAGCGPMSMRSVVAIGSFVAWPGIQNFWTWSGNAQPLQCDVQDWMFSLVNRSMVGRVFGSPNPTFSELFWDWPDEGAGECDRYVALNYGDPAHPWTIGQRHRTAADATGTMDFPILAGLKADGTNALFLHEYGWTDDGAMRAPLGMIYAESGNIVLGEGDRRYHCRQLVFDAAPEQQMVGYRFLVREEPFDAVGETDTGLYTVLHDGLMDMRWSARSARMRMEAINDGPWAIGRPRIEVRPGGRR